MHRFIEVSIKCDGRQQSEQIRKSSKYVTKWCVARQPSVCDRRKFTVAERACRTLDSPADGIYTKLASAETCSEIPSRTALLNDGNDDMSRALLAKQMVIEEQPILIEQRRLEWLKLELSIKRNKLTAFGAGD